jgi:RHS repeat-associated protein
LVLLSQLYGARNRIEILAGQYFDEETILHYNYHRYYNPTKGRYLTSDPLRLSKIILYSQDVLNNLKSDRGNVESLYNQLWLYHYLFFYGLASPQTQNLYSYVQNSPAKFVDPEGLIAAQLIGGWVGLLFGGVSGYISSGGDWGATTRSAAVGFGAGVLSTLGIPGAQAVLGNYGATLFSGLVMGSVSGFVGNIGTQVIVEGKSLECIDYDSAILSAAAGGLGGSLGAASTGISSIQGLPLLTDFGADILSSSFGGISAGAYDALLHY